MTIADLKPFIELISFVFSIGAIVLAWFLTRRKDVDSQFKKGSDRMDGLELRIQKTEQTVDVMPAKDDMHKLEVLLAEMGGDMKAMRATMRGMAESQVRTETAVSRHEDYLRGNDK